jgi:hypothetical protein
MEGNPMHLITITRDEDWLKLDEDPTTERDKISEPTLIEVETNLTEESEIPESLKGFEPKKVFDYG